jgi:predicted membrane channel-forming protein YqfA (hemolysin III family)
MLLSLTISPLGDYLVTKNKVWLNILSIVLIMLLIAASTVPPCLIATFKVFLKFGAFKERFYYEII